MKLIIRLDTWDLDAKKPGESYETSVKVDPGLVIHAIQITNKKGENLAYTEYVAPFTLEDYG